MIMYAFAPNIYKYTHLSSTLNQPGKDQGQQRAG